MQLCSKHISAAVNQHNSRGSGVFCGSAPRLYNKDHMQLGGELSQVSGILSCSRELRESVIKDGGKEGIRLCKEDFMCATVTMRLL
jgi:hypothetical protein